MTVNRQSFGRHQNPYEGDRCKEIYSPLLVTAQMAKTFQKAMWQFIPSDTLNLQLSLF